MPELETSGFPAEIVTCLFFLQQQNALILRCGVLLYCTAEMGVKRFWRPCDANFAKMTYYIIEARAYARIMAGTYE